MNALFKRVTIWCTLFILLIVSLFISCKRTNKPTIASSSIDRVSKELADACNRYDQIYNFHNGLARVKKENKFGFIDKSGKEIIKCSYDNAGDFDLGFCEVEISTKKGIIDRFGCIVVPTKYESVEILADTTFAVRYEDKCGVVGTDGKNIIPFDYLWVDFYSEGFYVVRQYVGNEVKFGLVNKYTKKLLNSYYFDEVFGDGFHEGMCAIRNGDDWQYIDKNGSIIIGSNFDNSYFTVRGNRFQNGYTTVEMKSNDSQFAFINKSGRIVTNPINGYVASSHNNYWIIDTDPSYGERGVLTISSFGCKWVIQPYPQAIYLSSKCIEDNIAFVERNHNTWYIIKLSTGEVISSTTDEIFPNTYNDGLFLTKRNGLYGWMNANSLAIPCIYTYADSYKEGFSEGFALVEKYGVWGYVDKYGNDTFSLTSDY